ncbi:esterase/lipase/thioesterase family protein [hydrothermal vent metagenome]|uniref:Esterase/lipase/thioesterase family protein n=1 Tax=hydrothermal vent metagenome TaxID=652676 RepID=A0A3B1CHK9_9ZZZZ
MRENYSYTTSSGNVISITSYGNENISNNSCIVITHGFKGFKDWGFFPYTAEYLSNLGFFVITFNFSHNGIGSNKLEFTELEKFAENTFSLEIEELSEIIKAYKEDFFGKVNDPKIGLLGHSRGGAIALLTATRLNEINAVATWSSVSNLDRYSERQKFEWRKKGYFAVMNSRTKQEMRLNVSLLDDLEENADNKLSITTAIANLGVPLLIAHGKEDLAVKFQEAEELYEHSDKSITELFPIENTGHTFGCVHPFAGTNEKFDKLIIKTGQFFKSKL